MTIPYVTLYTTVWLLILMHKIFAIIVALVSGGLGISVVSSVSQHVHAASAMN